MSAVFIPKKTGLGVEGGAGSRSAATRNGWKNGVHFAAGKGNQAKQEGGCPGAQGPLLGEQLGVGQVGSTGLTAGVLEGRLLAAGKMSQRE